MADQSRALFESVVSLLAPVLEELVFVGGCTTGIFVTDPAAGGIRPTKDVDAIVDVTSYAQYTALSDRLRTLGLVEDTSEGAPLCRWRKGNVIVDVMPTDASVLGFSNRWYPMAIDTAQRLNIGGHAARIVTPTLFVATKLEAFHGRGDDRGRHLYEPRSGGHRHCRGRCPEIVDDVAAADEQVRAYIATEFRSLLESADFTEALAGFLLPDAASQARRTILEQRLRLLAR